MKITKWHTGTTEELMQAIAEQLHGDIEMSEVIDNDMYEDADIEECDELNFV